MMQRRLDPITGQSADIEELYVLQDFPVNMLARYGSDAAEDAVFDMRFGIFPDSGVIRLTESVPEELVYVDTHSNAVGGVWKRQHAALAEIMSRYFPRRVLELGGATGVLESTYNRNAGEKVERWLIIDPAPNPIDTGAEFIKGFFPDVFPHDYRFDMLVHSHTWEHAHSSREFLRNITEIMPVNARMVFSIPNLRHLLENAMTSILNFEHTVYLSDLYVEYLLKEFGFQIEEKQYFENHSVMYSVVKKKRRQGNPVNLREQYSANKKLFMTYINRHKEKMDLINEKLINENAPVFIFGAHISTQFYLSFGLKKDKIRGILDNDRFKWDKRVCGTEWQVTSPAILKNYNDVVVILPDGPYSEEIKSQILGEINCKTKIIEVSRL